MTIAGRNGFRFFLRIFSLGNAIFAALLIFIKNPSFSTPLFQYPLLAALHALVLGSLLPLVFDRYYRDTSAFRIGALFSCVGEAVIVAGFLIHPRSPLPSEGGMMVATGILMGAIIFRSRNLRFVYWVALAGSALMGIYLGKVLDRPFIDPIPFSTIASHGLVGMALGLLPLFWGREENKNEKSFLLLSLVAFVMGFLVLALSHTLISWSLYALVLCVGLLSGLGLTMTGRGLGILCVLLTGVLALSENLLPGEWISLLGLLLLVVCYFGYFIRKFYEPDEAVSD